MKTVLVTFCCVTNWPQPSNLKPRLLPHIVSEGQKSGSGLASWVWVTVSLEVAFKVSAGPIVIWKLDWTTGSIAFLFWFLAGFISLLALARGLCVSVTMPLCWNGHLQHASWLPSERVSESNQDGYLGVFKNLVLEVTNHPFYHTNLVRCGRKQHKDVNSRRWGTLGAILEAGYHRLPLLVEF